MPIELTREPDGHARRGVPHHDERRTHGLEQAHGVEQRLALVERARGTGEHDDVGAQALRGDLERRARAGRVLDERQHHGDAGERGAVGLTLGEPVALMGGGGEQVEDLVPPHALEPEQVPTIGRDRVIEIGGGPAHDSTTRPRERERFGATHKRENPGAVGRPGMRLLRGHGPTSWRTLWTALRVEFWHEPDRNVGDASRGCNPYVGGQETRVGKGLRGRSPPSPIAPRQVRMLHPSERQVLGPWLARRAFNP
jgi:hypothetical protein